MLDEVSFKLVDAGADDEALRVLLGAYPFANADAAQRDVLFQRMIPLVEHRRGELTDPRFHPLRAPLDTPTLRSRQCVLWTSVGDCETVRVVLGDLSPEYGHDDWLRLGDCAATADPSLARSAYATAHAMQPGGRGSMALAYIAFATGDYRASLDAWRTIGSHRLAADELLAASTTALAAGEDAQALTWLEAYASRGGTFDDRYWSLLGRSRMRSDVAGALAAFERAVALRPDVNDLLHLAQLERDPLKQVRWREAAAKLVPTDAGVQADLGFAYLRAGRTADAVRALEAAFRADPSNMMVARQLVYAEQRLSNNSSARRYVERVLDTPGAFAQGAGDLTSLEQADQRFGFQRLHEDLGRRVTVNLDGFSGTGVGARTATGQPGTGYRSYSQIEADVRLGEEPIRNGRTVSAYARVFADGGELHSALPADNAMLGAGLRWKPWRSQVIYFAAEAQNGLSDGSQHDALLRASASFLNGGRFADDWHPARAGWFSQNLYLDAARYLRSDFNALTADYRTSYHKRVADGSTLEPYAHLQFNASGSSSLERDVRGGSGLRWNIWYGGSRYDADPHKLSFGIEFQQAFETYLPDRSSLFLTLGSRW
jgi:adsorption protein A